MWYVTLPLVLQIQIFHHIIIQVVLNRFAELLGLGLCRDAVDVHECDAIAEIGNPYLAFVIPPVLEIHLYMRLVSRMAFPYRNLPASSSPSFRTSSWSTIDPVLASERRMPVSVTDFEGAQTQLVRSRPRFLVGNSWWFSMDFGSSTKYAGCLYWRGGVLPSLYSPDMP